MTSLIEIVENSLKLLSAYPKAKFRTAVGTPAAGKGTGPDDITKWTLSFFNGLHTHVEIVFNQGVFSQPQLIHWGLFGNAAMPVPWGLDIAEAIQCMRKAGYSNPFYGVVLLFPIGPGANEPLYIFYIDQEGDQRITVGAQSGSVHGPH
jgi:hypothetical protein